MPFTASCLFVLFRFFVSFLLFILHLHIFQGLRFPCTTNDRTAQGVAQSSYRFSGALIYIMNCSVDTTPKVSAVCNIFCYSGPYCSIHRFNFLTIHILCCLTEHTWTKPVVHTLPQKSFCFRSLSTDFKIIRKERAFLYPGSVMF